MAAERGISRPALTEQLRDAIDHLAMEYEHVAYASVGGEPHGARADGAGT